MDSACKEDPDNPQGILAAYGIIQQGLTKAQQDPNGETGEQKWDFVVVRTDGRQVRQAWRKEQYIDASLELYGGNFTMDTAPYRLTDELRAFGVRFHSSARGPVRIGGGMMN